MKARLDVRLPLVAAAAVPVLELVPEVVVGQLILAAVVPVRRGGGQRPPQLMAVAAVEGPVRGRRQRCCVKSKVLTSKPDS